MNQTKRLERMPIKYNGDLHENRAYHEKLKKMGIEIVDTIDTASDELMMRVSLPENWSIEREGGYWSYLMDGKNRKRGMMFTKFAPWDQDAFFSFLRRFKISSEIADYDKSKFEEKPRTIQDGYEEVWIDAQIEEYDLEDGIVFLAKGEEEIIFQNGKLLKKAKRIKHIPNPEYVKIDRYEKYSQPFHFEVMDFDKKVLFKSSVVKTEMKYSKEKHNDFFDHRRELEEQAQQECINWLNANYPEWEDAVSYWD